jgi:hypothetical protein
MSITWKCDGDLLLDGAGRLVECQGIEKAAQDMLESFLNNRDPTAPDWYNGSEFYRIDKLVAAASGMGVDVTIEQFARDAIQRLMELQENDPYVDSDELIAEIQILRALAMGNLTWAFFAKCITESLEPATVGFDVTTSQRTPNLQGSGYQPGVRTLV